MQRVVVGLSGGVDSFVTALLLQQRGYEVTGVYLDLWGEADVAALAVLCQRLHITFIREDGRELFRQKVVCPFIEGYCSGRTPNPCAICNNCIKWDLLKRVADRLGVTFIATGHYVRIAALNGLFYVHKGVDPHKDQSYFLWGLRQELLSRALTPLGDFTKEEVKTFARQHGYEGMADKKESMGICFLEGTDYRDFICKYVDKSVVCRPGNILDTDGRVIGEHTGLLNYTVGQKRELPLRDGQPLYVAKIESAANCIVADRKPGLCRTELCVKEVNIVAPSELYATDIEVKVRGLGLNPEGPATFSEQPDGTLKVWLSSPAWAVAPGQPVAFYRGDRLIGGGIAV